MVTITKLKNKNESTSFAAKEKNSTLAEAQWTILRSIEKRYKDVSIPGSKNKFPDNNWYTKADDTQVGYGKITWGNYINSQESRPLNLLCKLVVLQWMKNRGTQLNTLNTVLSQLRPFLELIRNKNILSGREGDHLIGFGYISEADLSVVIDTALVNAGNLDLAVRFCSRLSDFIAFSNYYGELFPLFSFEQSLPWENSNNTLTKWVANRCADLLVMFKETSDYQALPPETSLPLIERSMQFLDMADKIIEFHKDLVSSRRDTRNKPFLVSALRRFERKYVPIFKDLISPTYSTKGNCSYVSISWFGQFFKLARTACVNIILLTTGLRNVDLRNLQVGCCKPSGRVDMLYYISTHLKKTGNAIHIPVPEQTYRAICMLEQLKVHQNSRFILDSRDSVFQLKHERFAQGDILNKMLREFAEHFGIPFIRNNTGTETSAHCYRSTVAGWLGESSALSVLLVRRLFGHSNDLMPSIYLRNNPAFVKQRQKEKEMAAKTTALKMAEAARDRRLAGSKGEQLECGFEQHKGRSLSATDAEIFQSFTGMIEQRILDESVCGFMTPFGVRCMRNPADSSQPPCAKKSHRDKVKDIDKKLLDLINDINPQMCIGSKCSEAMLGPWSESILNTLKYYESLLKHQQGDAFTEEHFIEHAKQFIRQYSPAMKKVFGLEVEINA